MPTINHQTNCARFSQQQEVTACVPNRPMPQLLTNTTVDELAHVTQNCTMQTPANVPPGGAQSFPHLKNMGIDTPMMNRQSLVENGNGSSFVMENLPTNNDRSALGSLLNPLVHSIKVESGSVPDGSSGNTAPINSNTDLVHGQSNGPFFVPAALKRSPGHKSNPNGRCHWPYTAQLRGGFMSRGSRGGLMKGGRGSGGTFGKMNGGELSRTPFGMRVRSRVRVAKVTQPRANIACTLCDFSTAYSHSLDVHMKSIHSMERPFSCVLCEYTCKLKGNLKKHYVGTHKLETEPAESLLKHSSNNENTFPSQVSVLGANAMKTPERNESVKQSEENEPSISEIYEAYNSAEFSDFLVDSQETTETGATTPQLLAATVSNLELDLKNNISSQEMLPADLTTQTTDSQNFVSLGTILSP